MTLANTQFNSLVVTNRITEKVIQNQRIIFYSYNGTINAARKIKDRCQPLLVFGATSAEALSKSNFTLWGRVLSVTPRLLGGGVVPPSECLVNATAFADWLAQSPSITSIELCRSKLTVDILTELASVLCSPQIKQLHLHSSSIGNCGVKVLAPHLKRSNIEYLNLGGNQIGNPGVSELLPSLPETLTELDLGNNNIGSPGAMAVADALSSLNLIQLHLHNNQIDATGIKALLKAFDSSRTLTNLRVQKNVFDPGAKEALRSLLADTAKTVGGLERSVEELKLDE